MEDLARMVADSLARHGYDAPVDHRRLDWSRWFRCESSLSFLLVPSAPGIYALGEELGASGPSTSSPIAAKRMLAVFEIADSEDLSSALARLFAPGHPLRERMASGRCFARFARVSDPDQRRAASSALRQWLASSMEVATGFGTTPFSQPEPSPPTAPAVGVASRVATRRSPPPLPAGF